MPLSINKIPTVNIATMAGKLIKFAPNLISELAMSTKQVQAFSTIPDPSCTKFVNLMVEYLYIRYQWEHHRNSNNGTCADLRTFEMNNKENCRALKNELVNCGMDDSSFPEFIRICEKILYQVCHFNEMETIELKTYLQQLKPFFYQQKQGQQENCVIM